MKTKLIRASAGLITFSTIILIIAKIIYPFCLIRDTGQVNGQLFCCEGRVQWWHPNSLPVPITINRSGSKQAPGEATANGIRSAMQTWNEVRSSFFEFSDAGLTDQNFMAFDRINIVVFDTAGVNFPVGSNALAFSRTITTVDELGFRSIDSDLVFNARDFAFTVGANQNSFDIESIALHELGHHLGLGHAGGGRDLTDASFGCGPVVGAAVMFFASSFGQNQRVLHPDDIAGMTQIYPKWILEGSVTDDKGMGVIDASIRLDGTTVPRDTIAISDLGPEDFGLFSAPVIDSSFTVIVSKFGLKAQTLKVTFLTPETMFEVFTLEPLPKRTLQGTVLDHDTGQGISAKIELFANGEVLREATTDSGGNFVFQDIPITDTLSTRYNKIRVEPELPYPVVDLEQEIIITEDKPSALEFVLAPAEVLLVDDDGGDGFENFFSDALENIGLSYVSWDVNIKGTVKEGIQTFPQKPIIWLTGNGLDNFLSTTELDSLRSHLLRGGSLFLTGQNIAEHLSEQGSSFLSEVLHVSWGGNNPDPILHGVQTDPVGNGLNLIAIGGGDGARNQTSPDLLIPDGQANVSIVYDTTQGTASGVRIEEPIPGSPGSRLVFFGFGFEGINNLPPGVATREQVISNVLAWLNEMPTSVASQFNPLNIIENFALLPNYPNPFNGETIISYQIPSDVSGTAVTLKIFNLLGQEVHTLVDEQSLKPGEYTVRWDGRNASGLLLSSGVYLYRLEADNFHDARKLVYIR